MYEVIVFEYIYHIETKWIYILIHHIFTDEN